MTRGGPGNLPPKLAELLDLVDRLGRQAHKFVESLSPAQLCELAQQAATLRAVTPRPFTHLGAVVRWLREAAGLSRTMLATYLPAFFAAGALCIVAALIILAIARPKPAVA